MKNVSSIFDLRGASGGLVVVVVAAIDGGSLKFRVLDLNLEMRSKLRGPKSEICSVLLVCLAPPISGSLFMLIQCLLYYKVSLVDDVQMLETAMFCVRVRPKAA